MATVPRLSIARKWPAPGSAGEQAINAKGPLPGMLAAGLSKTDLDQITFSGHVIVTRLPVHQQIVVSGQQTAMRDECIDENVK